MGMAKGIKSALKDHKEKIQGPHFLFSAENPKHPEKNELKMDHNQVLGHLRGAGHDAHSVNGHYGAPEKSIAVYGVSPEHAEKLHGVASKLGQDSSIYSTGKKHEMRFHHGNDAGKKVHGEGTVWHKEKPKDMFTTLPGGRDHFTHNFDFDKSESGMEDYKEFKKSEKESPKESLKAGDKIPQCYKEEASKGFDVLFRVKIKGEDKLTDGIYLHMSLKIFKDRKEFDLEEIKKIVKDYNIAPPPVKDLHFKTTILKSERNGQEYHMLIIEGLDDKYKKLYDHFKDVGTVYKKFLAHITINKSIYDDIEKNGLKPEDVKFGPLLIEAGPGNTICRLGKSEDLEKGFKNKLASVALGTAGLLSNPANTPAPQAPKMNPTPSAYSTQKMLRTIASVESNNGKNMNHKPTAHGTAYGKWALMPDTIHETINMSPKLKAKYGKATKLQGQDLQHYMQDNPGLEDQVAEQHIKRLEHHFGQDPKKIGYGWNQGITGTNRALKEKKDIDSHPYTQKILNDWSKEK